MDMLAPFITAMTTTIAILSALWIYRRTQRLDTVHLVLSVGIIIYTVYHFYACGVSIVLPTHEIITGFFLSSVAWVNAYCSTCNTTGTTVIMGINRRVKKSFWSAYDRRKSPSHSVLVQPDQTRH